MSYLHAIFILALVNSLGTVYATRERENVLKALDDVIYLFSSCYIKTPRTCPQTTLKTAGFRKRVEPKPSFFSILILRVLLIDAFKKPDVFNSDETKTWSLALF